MLMSRKATTMSVHAEPIYWPESLEETEEEPTVARQQQIVQLRHRVGNYDVTRLILDSRETSETRAK